MTQKQKDISYQEFHEEIKTDYYTAVLSRECSLMGRREVLTGKAKFGIFGAGKELAQIAQSTFSVLALSLIVILFILTSSSACSQSTQRLSCRSAAQWVLR